MLFLYTLDKCYSDRSCAILSVRFRFIEIQYNWCISDVHVELKRSNIQIFMNFPWMYFCIRGLLGPPGGGAEDGPGRANTRRIYTYPYMCTHVQITYYF